MPRTMCVACVLCDYFSVHLGAALKSQRIHQFFFTSLGYTCFELVLSYSNRVAKLILCFSGGPTFSERTGRIHGARVRHCEWSHSVR